MLPMYDTFTTKNYGIMYDVVISIFFVSSMCVVCDLTLRFRSLLSALSCLSTVRERMD